MEPTNYAESKLPDTAPNTIDHRMLYETIQNSPILLRYLQTVIYQNAIGLLKSDLPKVANDVEYIVAHAQSRGICMLAEVLIDIHEQGKELYGPKPK